MRSEHATSFLFVRKCAFFAVALSTVCTVEATGVFTALVLQSGFHLPRAFLVRRCPPQKRSMQERMSNRHLGSWTMAWPRCDISLPTCSMYIILVMVKYGHTCQQNPQHMTKLTCMHTLTFSCTRFFNFDLGYQRAVRINSRFSGEAERVPVRARWLS